jgi:basic membrane lipoprotein Med (substrate-binding protein (PBP1-ABC) superfamily)
MPKPSNTIASPSRRRTVAALALLAAGLASLAGLPLRAQQPQPAGVPVVFAAYATPLEEPWNMVVHDALLSAQRGGRIRYSWQDDLTTADKIAAAIRAELPKRPDIIVADAEGGDGQIREIAAVNPTIAFLIGTAEHPVPPNLSVFDSDLSEPAYLCGLIAGRLTKSNVVGVVGGKSEPTAHRTVNAYIAGVRAANPAVKVKVDFIGAWFDPPKAREATLRQIAAGADLIYAEREGAIAAAREKGVLAFGNMIDQHAEAPGTVITGPVWSMTPVIDHVVRQKAAGMVQGENLVDFSTLGRGGASLAPWHDWDDKLPADVLQLVRERSTALKAGTLQINTGTQQPVGD